jgi:TIR domain
MHHIRMNVPRQSRAVFISYSSTDRDDAVEHTDFFYRMHLMFTNVNASEYHSCFISYSGKDDAFARRLHADLQDCGVQCWFAPENMKIGEKFRVRIDEVIHVYDKLLLILSKHSVMSDWVEKEVETAFERERQRRQPVLFPVRLDNAILDIQTGWAADIRRTRHIGDFRRWKRHEPYQEAFARLLRDLQAPPAGEHGPHTAP